jgi:hypothetical protein
MIAATVDANGKRVCRSSRVGPHGAKKGFHDPLSLPTLGYFLRLEHDLLFLSTHPSYLTGIVDCACACGAGRVLTIHLKRPAGGPHDVPSRRAGGQ